ncbi:ice-binding family protein [Microbacterium hatanonis]|uniref:DUF3494 domain-containing protein n=1 Tax=Microbacterium hatanonis TaxID=404366 RepID=A0A5C8I2A6_9MICO|nr:ice-binding family protein [Microbacterium hatanonis]TXK12210.1 DUF3494 domain-containing protein [Microbacterium hatanonis]
MGTHTSVRRQSVGSVRVAQSAAVALIVSGLVLVGLTVGGSSAVAATSVGLGTAEPYVVLGGQSVTNTGNSTLDGDLGVYPGTSITGFPPGQVIGGGVIHQTDENAEQAQIDLVTAYNAAASQAPDATITADLGGQTLVDGVYFSASTVGLTGTLRLDGQGDSGSVWVFQVGSALTTATGSVVELINGAQACNVFWQVGSSATLGTDSTFVGTILALTSITLENGTTVDGRALARNGTVSLDDNTFVDPGCDAGPSPSPSATPTDTPTATPTVTPTATPTATPTVTPTITPTATPTITPTVTPTVTPTATPTITPTATPTITPTVTPTVTPTITPTATPTITPTATPTITPTATPTITPTATPTVTPTATPTVTPTVTPTATPTVTPTATPTVTPTATPTATATAGIPLLPTSGPTTGAPTGPVVNGGGMLPATGSDGSRAWMLLGAAAAFLLGGSILFTSRRFTSRRG